MGFGFRKSFDPGGKKKRGKGAQAAWQGSAFEAHMEAAARARTPNDVIRHLQQAHLAEPARTEVLRWLLEVLPIAGRHDEAREVREEVERRAAKKQEAGEASTRRAAKLQALQDLASLRERGHITQAEFEAEKAKILG